MTMIYTLLLDTMIFILIFVFFFKQKTAYEMRISDWSSDVCSSDLTSALRGHACVRWPVWPGRRLRSFRLLPARTRPARRQPPRCLTKFQIGRASCRERVCQYV